MSNGRQFAALLLINILLISVLIWQTASQRAQPAEQTSPNAITTLSTTTPEAIMPGILASGDLAGQQEALVSLYRAVSQGVVSLQMETPVGPRQGSGFVFDLEGHIVTNFHVVSRATYIEVVFQNGMRTEGRVVGFDENSDLAVVAVNVPEAYLVPLVLGDSDEVEVGQLVIAIGNPFGFSGTMSTGIVSNLTRTQPALNNFPTSGLDVFAVGDLIQTDAAINPGNSGGPLISLNGEVIGLNRAIVTYYYNIENASLSSGVGFAISANVLKRVVPALITDGQYDYPYLGLTSLTQLTLASAEEFGLDRTTGAYIRTVEPGGPAERAGLLVGDLIINVNGDPVNSSTDLAAFLLTQAQTGDTIYLLVIREGEELIVEMLLEGKPEAEVEE